jgi:hypothetical protein
LRQEIVASVLSFWSVDEFSYERVAGAEIRNSDRYPRRIVGLKQSDGGLRPEAPLVLAMQAERSRTPDKLSEPRHHARLVSVLPGSMR